MSTLRFTLCVKRIKTNQVERTRKAAKLERGAGGGGGEGEEGGEEGGRGEFLAACRRIIMLCVQNRHSSKHSSEPVPGVRNE